MYALSLVTRLGDATTVECRESRLLRRLGGWTMLLMNIRWLAAMGTLLTVGACADLLRPKTPML